MSVLLIAGSPSAPSRSTALLDAVAERLARRHAQIDRLAIRDLPAQALLLADWNHPAIVQAIAQAHGATVTLDASPRLGGLRVTVRWLGAA